MLDMIALVLEEDQDIVEVNKNKSVDHVSEHVIDECLKDRRGVGKPKRHDQILKVPSGGVKKAVFYSPPSLIQTK